MASPRHLPNAPITEAVIDIRVRLPPGTSVDTFSKLRSELADWYPVVEEQRVFESGVQFEKDGLWQMARDRGLQGLVFRSSDGLNVAQFRLDGLSFSRLAPYTRWEDVLADARNAWTYYVSAAAPEVVTRIGVRYINRLPIVSEGVELAEYLTAPPPVPPSLPQTLRGFLTRIVLRDEDSGLDATLTQAIAAEVQGNDAVVLLDIACHSAHAFEATSQEMWECFEELRGFKNRIFFGSITEKTASLFE